MSNLFKICRVGAELFHADGRTDGHTDMTKLIVTFRNLTKAPENLPLMLSASATRIESVRLATATSAWPTTRLSLRC